MHGISNHKDSYDTIWDTTIRKNTSLHGFMLTGNDLSSASIAGHAAGKPNLQGVHSMCELLNCVLLHTHHIINSTLLTRRQGFILCRSERKFVLCSSP